MQESSQWPMIFPITPARAVFCPNSTPMDTCPGLMGRFHRPREQTVVSQSNRVGAEQMEIKIIVCPGLSWWDSA